MKIHHAKTIEEAIDDFEGFLQSDLWYAIHSECKNETDMLKYLGAHFDIFRKEIKIVSSSIKDASQGGEDGR